MALELNEQDVTLIGQVERGIDGTDNYYAVGPLEEGTSLEAIRGAFLQRYYRDTAYPGGYFCHNVSVVPQEHSTTRFIVTVHGRYDV